MKKLVFLLALTAGVVSFAQSGPPAGEAKVGEFYGKDINKKAAKKAMSPEALVDQLKSNDKVSDVVIKGKVADVCPKKGCWISIKTEAGENIFVKMKDYAFFVPMALIGKEVVLEGNAETKVTSVKELQHYAEDAKKSKEEIEAIKEPKSETRFLASAIKVVK